MSDVTFVMPVRNGSAYIAEAVASVRAQTHPGWELVVVDDGSTDDSAAVAEAAGGGDPRVRVERLPVNRGTTAALEHGFALARGRYLARMDADDVALPTRLARQLAYMEANPDVVMSGCGYRTFGGKRWTRVHPAEDAAIRSKLFFKIAITGPTQIVRRDFRERTGLVTPVIRHAEDYAIEVEAAILGGRLGNLEEVLYLYRQHPTSVCHAYPEAQIASTRLVQARAFEHLAGRMLSMTDADRLIRLSGHERIADADMLEDVLGFARDLARHPPAPLLRTTVERMAAETLMRAVRTLPARAVVKVLMRPAGRWAKDFALRDGLNIVRGIG